MESATISNFPGYTFYRNGEVKNKNGQLMGSDEKTGYITSSFVDITGKRCKKRLHILIMWAFSGEAPGDRETDHISNIRINGLYDNSYSNLQYLTKLEHARKTQNDNPNTIHARSQRPIEGIHKDGSIVSFKSIGEAADFLQTEKEKKILLEI